MEAIHPSVAADVQDEIFEADHGLFCALDEKYGLGINTVSEIVLSRLEGVIIPEEESEELRARADKEGKTFTALVVEYVNRGLEDDASFDREARQFKAEEDNRNPWVETKPSSDLMN
jgi:hypothetical protein